MDFPEDGTRVLCHEDERESWSFALRAPTLALRGLVEGYCLYEERRSGSPRRQHLPHRGVTFIIGIEGKLDVRDPTGGHCGVAPGQGFIGGLHTGPAQTRSERSQRGMEIKLTPLAAHLVLGGLPMHELSNRVFLIEDLRGADGREFGQRLAEATEAKGHRAAFEIVDQFLARRILDPPPRTPKPSSSPGSRSLSATGRFASGRFRSSSVGA